MGTVIGRERQGDIRVRATKSGPVVEQTLVYLVRATSKFEPDGSVILSPGIPRVNQTVTTDGWAMCKNVRASRRDDHAELWTVTAEFSSEIEEGQQNPAPGSNPEQWIPIYETKSERLQEIVTKDVNGVAIANSAGQPFENGLTITRLIPVWDFFQFESAAIDDETILERNELVNENEFRGRDPKTLLLTVVSSVIGIYYGAPRRLTEYQLRYNKDTWLHRRLDVGTIFLDGTTRKPFLDDDGETVITGALNGSGAKATGTPPKPAELEFDIYDTDSFAFLRIA